MLAAIGQMQDFLVTSAFGALLATGIPYFLDFHFFKRRIGFFGWLFFLEIALIVAFFVTIPVNNENLSIALFLAWWPPAVLAVVIYVFLAIYAMIFGRSKTYVRWKAPDV